MQKTSSTLSFLIGLMVVLVMWIVFFADKIVPFKFYQFGVLPKSFEGLKGIIFSPLIHDSSNYNHIINNSVPTIVLIFIIHQRFTKIFWKILILTWFISGSLLWVFAQNNNSYHIGMSGVIYGLASFIFTIGVINKFLPYQALSLFIVFVYGSLIWGVFPSPQPVSWEGHLTGLISGVFLAILYRKKIPQRPKFSYEIEKELGIDPPDLEGFYKEQIEKQNIAENKSKEDPIKVVYDYKENPSQNNNKKSIE